MTDAIHARRKLTTAEAADYLNLSPSYLYQRRRAGDGPTFLRCGRAVRYDVADLDAWLEKRRRRSTADDGRDNRPAHQREHAAA